MYSALPNDHRSDRTTQPPARYDTTHWETGSLARQETARAASKRRRRHLQEQLELSLRYEELLAAQLEAFRRTTALRRALQEEENNDTIALSSDSPRRPSTAAATNSNQPRPQQQQPAPLLASRTLDSASVHSNIRPDSNTPGLKHNESTSTKLTTQQRYVSPPPTQVIHLPSENHVQHPSTCTDSETTNRGYYAVDQAASAKKAATVKQHTAHATSSTKSTSLPSKPLSCEHTEQWPTNPMTVLLYAHAQANLPFDKQLFAYSSSSPTGCFTDPNFDHLRDDDHTLRGSTSSISLLQLTTDSWQQQSSHHAVDPRLTSTAFHDDGPKQQHRLRFVFHAKIASART